MSSRARAAAFFDIDGTLMALPSLEHGFFRLLRYRRAIPAVNYVLWLEQALRLAPHGIEALRHANKMYLRGIRAEEAVKKITACFFAKALERAVWHASEGHAIVLVSGTLEFLAQQTARAIEAALRERGCETTIHVCATRLEQRNGSWTGSVLGDAMYGEAKARAALRIAESEGISLADSYAYGDSASDRWLLEVVGHPAAVNPSLRLRRLAARRGWPILWWKRAGKTARYPCASFGAFSETKQELLKEDRWERVV